MKKIAAREQIINEFINEGREVIDWTLFDSLFISTASAQNRLVFFQQTVGQVGHARTNMNNAGLLPAPEQFLIEEIWCTIVNTDGVRLQYDITNHDHPLNVFLAQGYWDFNVEPKTMYQGHLSENILPHEEYTYVTSAPTNVIVGHGGQYAKLYLREPIVLGSTRHFDLTATLTAPAAGDGFATSTTLMFWFLKGLKRRNR